MANDIPIACTLSASDYRRDQKLQGVGTLVKEVGDLLSALREHDNRARRRVAFAPPSARITAFNSGAYIQDGRAPLPRR